MIDFLFQLQILGHFTQALKAENVLCETDNFLNVQRQECIKSLTTQNKQELYGDEENKTKEFSLTAGVG